MWILWIPFVPILVSFTTIYSICKRITCYFLFEENVSSGTYFTICKTKLQKTGVMKHLSLVKERMAFTNDDTI